MDSVDIRRLQENATSILARVKAGESVTISDRGDPVAMMVSLAPTNYADLIKQGRVREAKASVTGLPPARPLAGLDEVLGAQRDSELY